MSQTSKITLIGTGLMGAPMSRNLMKAGHDLTVWNRSPERAAPLVAEGAKTAVTAAQAIAGAEVIITMVSDGYAIEALLAHESFINALNAGMIWIDMSSAKPEHARAQSAHLAALGVAHLDAPVSGGTKGAEAGSLAIMAGGDPEIFNQVTDIFSAMGRPVHVGPSGAGQLCKLANQTIVAVTIAAVAEATLLAEKGGADPAALRAAIKGGFPDSVDFATARRTHVRGQFCARWPVKVSGQRPRQYLGRGSILGLAVASSPSGARPVCIFYR